MIVNFIHKLDWDTDIQLNIILGVDTKMFLDEADI